jgi:hypothetical protein
MSRIDGWFKRTDREILAKVIASNGGGFSPHLMSQAAVRRLRNAGLIQAKKGKSLAGGYVHTPAGLEFWRALNPVTAR